MNSVIRHLSAELHPFEIGFFRSFFGLLVLTPLFLRHGFEPLRTRRLGLHALRALLNGISLLTTFTALSLIPLATYTALSFSAPLFAPVLALVLLGEVMRVRRVLALAFGFAGALVVLRPGFGGLDLGAILALCGAAAWAVAMIAIKVLARTDSSVTITLYVGLFMTPFTFLAAIPFWETPSSSQLGWLALIGGLASVTHLTFAQAFKEADTAAVLPLDFTKLIWASILGYLWFAEIPDAWTWIGGTMIFSAVTYIAHRERLAATAGVPPPEPAAAGGAGGKALAEEGLGARRATAKRTGEGD